MHGHRLVIDLDHSIGFAGGRGRQSLKDAMHPAHRRIDRTGDARPLLALREWHAGISFVR